MTIVLDALAEHIDSHLDRFAASGRSTRWEPADPSAPYEADKRLAERQYGPARTHGWGFDEIRYGMHAATLATSVSSQLLEGVLACIRYRDVMFSLAPLVRSIEEHCGYVHWLLYTGDPGWSVRDRVAHIVLARINDLTKYKSTAKLLKYQSLGKIGDSLHLARKVDLPAMFYASEIAVTKQGDLILRGEGFPRLSALPGWMERTHNLNWNSAGVYSILSSATHPTFSHFKEFVNVADDGSTRWQLDDPQYLYRMTRAALVSFGVTWQILVAYLGHPQQIPLALQQSFDADARFADL